jgi:hypothetical protein
VLGFQDVQFDANGTATSTTPAAIPGYLLTNGLDNARNRRPVAFLFTGSNGRADGADVFVTAGMLTDSVNARLLAGGEAYPLFYNGLPAVLRDFLTGLAARARADDKGLWPADRSLSGIKATSRESLKKYVFFPKLYRRLKDYFVQTGATSLAGFDAWIRSSPVERDDAVWIGPLRELANLHNVYRVSGGRIKVLYRSDELVFQSQGALVRPAVPVTTERPRVRRGPPSGLAAAGASPMA